jgi:hypothetical protein
VCSFNDCNLYMIYVFSHWLEQISYEFEKPQHGHGIRKSSQPIMGVAWVAYAANASSFTTVVPKVRVTGLSSVDTICELSLFDVLFSPMLRGFSPGSPVSSLCKNQCVSLSVVCIEY